MDTAMDELCDTVESDWEKNVRVSFIGEDGVDCGGLTREFFTLLFKNCSIFENKTFKLNSKLLAERTYFLLGKATAYAVINGHPGTRLLNNVLSNYLCSSKEPKTSDFDIRDLNRAVVEAAIEEIGSSGTDELPEIGNKYGELLQTSGFRRLLTESNKGEASSALKCHFLFYEVMGPLLQFMEDSLSFFQQSNCDGSTILTFNQPSYSDDEEKKAGNHDCFQFWEILEENWGCISTVCVNPDDWTVNDTVLTLEHILQAFLGSEALPTDINSGIIEFDYEMDAISKVNTCAPSITFRRIDQLQVYEEFQQHMLHIMTGSIGFGIE